ncbi:thyrotropin-releasing hormone receptor-like [Asterias amurensis]|uniref:thyrotropin-releasing hormone receptor-like n=1 Tax=Asterias amurensis TaxID=7602 RepID=UPI003AB1B5F2
MGANNQVAAACDSFVNLTVADDSVIQRYTFSGVTIQVKIISIIIVLTVGLLGNCAFLFVIARVRTMQTLVNFYLVNLAFADLILLVENAAIPIVYYFGIGVPSSGHYIGAPGCIANNFFAYLGYFASITLVCLISTERYLAVCHPLKHLSINTKSRASKLLVGAWAVAVLFSIWAIPIQSVHQKVCIEWPETDEFSNYPEHVGRCRPSALWNLLLFDALQTVPFFSALICNAVFFTKIIRNLRGRSTFERESVHTRRTSRTTHQVTTMLVANVVVFFICHAPFQFLNMCGLIANLAGQQLFSNPVTETFILLVFRILVSINSAANPIVYNATNSRYRRAFIRAFTCSTRGKGGPRARSTFVTVKDNLVEAGRSVKRHGEENVEFNLNETTPGRSSQYSQLTRL